jgi:N-acetylglucosaminyldiphosphoundecaprenol N-acetyl-beta-D-mannosaminyltransferase
MEAGATDAPRINIMGVCVSAINLDDAVGAIETWIARRRPHYVCITGAHGVIESQRDPCLRNIHNAAGLVAPDGMPVVWLAHWLGAKHTRRVYGPDLMRALTEVSARRGYRQFYYGGVAGVAEKLRDELLKRHPRLQVVGTMCPPFRPLSDAEDEAIVAAINRADPDIVWVGLSTPKQEYWMAEHRTRIKAPVIIGVGAAFDFLAGAKRQAPPWMQRNGLEWLFRLLSEPRRLWRRYAMVVPAFIFLGSRQLMAARAKMPTAQDR